MRLSPKSIFFGLVALGLPIAVTVGWQLATPLSRSAASDPPSGAGGIGNAPARPSPTSADTRPPAHTSAPTHTAAVSLPPVAATTSPVAKPTAVTSVSVAPIFTMPTVPATEASDDDALPPLTMPPVPTPTDPGPADPSDSFDPPPSSDMPSFEHHWRN